MKVRYDGEDIQGYFNQGATLVVNESMGMLTATSKAPVKSAPGLPAAQTVTFAEDVTYDFILRMSSTTDHPLDGSTVALDIVQGDTVTDLKSQANCNTANNSSGFSCSATRPLLIMPVNTETKRFAGTTSNMQACHPACESADSQAGWHACIFDVVPAKRFVSVLTGMINSGRVAEHEKPELLFAVLQLAWLFRSVTVSPCTMSSATVLPSSG